MTLDEAMDDYRMTFGENFPLMMVMGVDEDEIVDEIYECIERNEPCSYDDEVTY